jgi:hypothetical protein
MLFELLRVRDIDLDPRGIERRQEQLDPGHSFDL